MKTKLLIIWLILCLLALAYTLAAPYAEFTIIGFMLFMGILTFPSGLIPFYGATYLSNTFSVLNVGEVAYYVIVWFLMVLIGYYQWFKVTPWLYGRVRRKNA